MPIRVDGCLRLNSHQTALFVIIAPSRHNHTSDRSAAQSGHLHGIAATALGQDDQLPVRVTSAPSTVTAVCAQLVADVTSVSETRIEFFSGWERRTRRRPCVLRKRADRRCTSTAHFFVHRLSANALASEKKFMQGTTAKAGKSFRVMYSVSSDNLAEYKSPIAVEVASLLVSR